MVGIGFILENTNLTILTNSQFLMYITLIILLLLAFFIPFYLLPNSFPMSPTLLPLCVPLIRLTMHEYGLEVVYLSKGNLSVTTPLIPPPPATINCLSLQAGWGLMCLSPILDGMLKDLVLCQVTIADMS